MNEQWLYNLFQETYKEIDNPQLLKELLEYISKQLNMHKKKRE